VLRISRKNALPEPSVTRTDRDWVMIFLGVALILFFLGVGYLTVSENDRNPAQKIRGPVKDPRAATSLEGGVSVTLRGDKSHRRNLSLLCEQMTASPATPQIVVKSIESDTELEWLLNHDAPV
jgi:hypothetical protein